MIKPSSKKIVQINSIDTVGGAASVTSTLHCYFKDEGYDSKRIVGTKLGNDPHTVELRAAIISSSGSLPAPERFARLFSHVCRTLRHRMELRLGLEDQGAPAGRYLDDILPDKNEIILCSNLHGGFFDLATLPELSKRHPVVLLMHDAWLLAGHCAHSFDCEKWIGGCGNCPYLDVTYPLKRDTSHSNWLRKKRIYDSCSLYLVTPSQWLMDKVQHSILRPAVIKSRVINNGVDQEIFRPGDKEATRQRLGIDKDDHVVMFAANGIRESIWKDYATMRAAVSDAALALPHRPLRFIAVGESAPDEQIGPATISFLAYKTPAEMAQYYQAADVYIHAARAENFPNTVIEALSCGTPVLATAVGGVPEQVKGLRYQGDKSGLNHFDLDHATGILTPVGDVAALSSAISHLFGEADTLERLSVSAARDARLRFNIKNTGAQYLDFFDEIWADWRSRR